MTDLDKIVDGVLARQPLAGLSIGLVSRDGLDATAFRGVAGKDRPVDIDTVFRIGSVTKTMTALAVLGLQEAGQLDLDDPVNNHVKGVSLDGKPGWRPATIRHLLTHTAGIGEFAAWRDALSPMGGLAVRPGQQVPGVERYGGHLRLDVEPGTKWSYANHGFNVLGLMVEQLTGESLAEHLRGLIFDRLGMEHTDVVRSPRVTGDLATGYTLKRKGLVEPKDVDIAVPAAGSVFSTLPDMAAYVAALLSGGRGVVSPSTLADAFAPQYRPCPTHPGIGLSFFRDEIEGHTIVGHGGGWPGFITAMSLSPDDGVGVVAFTNGGSQAVSLIAHRALCMLLGVDPEPSPRRLQPERWADLVGWYKPDPGLLTNLRTLAFGGGFEIVQQRKQLLLRATAPVRSLGRGIPLQPMDDEGNVFAIEFPELGTPPLVIHVEHDEQGRAVALHIGGPVLGAFPAMRRSSPWSNPRRILSAAALTAGVGREVMKRRRRRHAV
jgi:CubicO group peptidase (beta-lactamase class C family)